MAFKINKQTRIKIPIEILYELRKDKGYGSVGIFISRHQHEFGLELTSRKYVNNKRSVVYYFRVIDKSKYFLAKIKHGI